VATHGVAFIRGMWQAGVATTAKHFPGLGRVSGNTDFTAGVVSQGHTETCAASDGTYQLTTATYTGTATSSDARLNGAVQLRVHSVVNTTTKLGFLDGNLRIRGTNGGASGNVHAAIANGAAVGSLVGEGNRPEAKLVASISAAFTPATGFATGKLGSGSANGAGVLFTRGDCRRPKQLPSTAVFHLQLTPGEVVPRVQGLDARGNGNLTLDLTRDASGNVTGGNVVFYINYRFPGSITLTGLALHQGVRGANGPVVLDAGIGTFTDSDGRGNITKVVSSASASLLQALLATPRGYYVDVSTSTNTGGALRDQLSSPEQR